VQREVLDSMLQVGKRGVERVEPDVALAGAGIATAGWKYIL
jgi:hypothetical protein